MIAHNSGCEVPQSAAQIVDLHLTITDAPHLERSLTLRSAVALNLLDMIGVGPFITLPLLLASMGGPQAMLGWILGALLALCDGLVWAELGAAFPAAGGTFHFLRRIYPGKLGRYLSFLFLFQLLISAPLSIASGAIGLSQYAGWLVPTLNTHTLGHVLHLGPYNAAISIGPATAVAVAAVLLAVFLLAHRLTHIAKLSLLIVSVVLGTIAAILISAAISPATHIRQAFALAPGAFHLSPAFFAGLASAMLVATYDYWGYYNIAFLGGEVRDPSRTIPRAILLSIAICAILYLALNLAILSVLPWQGILSAHNLAGRRALISVFAIAAWTPLVGPQTAMILGKLAAALIMLTAFASVFSLLLGYSRIPYAAALEGAFFAPFARLHPIGRYPVVSLLTLGAAASVFCLFSLADVIAALVVLRIFLQFLLQHIGVLYLRRSEPSLDRPFRLWLYPLPPIVAIAGFTYLLLGRTHRWRELLFAVTLTVVGSLLFLLRHNDTPLPLPVSNPPPPRNASK